MPQICCVDASTGTHHESTHDDSAVLGLLEEVIRVRFLIATRSEHPFSEVAGVEFLADVRDDDVG